MELDEHSSISNSGNLSIQQSSPFVHGDGDDNDDDDDDVQGLSKRLSFSSASSSSFNSPLDNPFEEDKGTGIGNSEHHMMKTSPANDGVDDQDLSKKFSRSSTLSSSSSSDSLFEGNFGIDDGVDAQAAGKLSRSSSSSSSDSPHRDPLGNKSVTSDNSLPELDHKPAVKDGKNGNPVSKNLPPKSVQATEVTNFSSESKLGNVSPTDSPPTQVMERTTKPKYRIPSHVFARNKSGNPDWSVASNDSLFSIHMDNNMSFTRDSQLFSLGESSSAPCQLINQSSNPLPGEPSNQQTGNKATNEESQAPGKAEAAVETTVEVAKENETDKMSIPVGQISHHPQESSVSNKSFAFPVLADEEKSPLVSSGDSSRSSSGKERSDSQKLSSPKNQESSEEAEQQPEVKEAVGAQLGLGAPWLSCLPCCS